MSPNVSSPLGSTFDAPLGNLGAPAETIAAPHPTPSADALLPSCVRQTLFCFVLVFVVAYGSILLTRTDLMTAPFWPANAIFLVLTLRSPWPPARRLNLLGAGAAASILANCLGGSGLPLSIWYTVANGADVLTAFWIIRFGQSVWRNKSRPVFSQLRQLALAAFTGPLVSALIGASGVFVLTQGSFSENFFRWYVAAALGMLMILPLGIMDYKDAWRKLRTKAGMRSAAFCLAVVAAAAVIVFAQKVSPFVFLVTAAILFATYHHRSIGAAASLVIVALIAVPFTAAGRGPLSLVVGQDETSRQLLLQAYLIAGSIVAVIAAAILDDRDGLRKVVERRAAAARHKAEAQAELIRHLVHEIRTPLNVIQGFAALMQDRGDMPAETRNMTNAIVESSTELLTLASGMLDHARIERGALHLQPVSFPVDDLFDELRAEFETAGAAARLEFLDAPGIAMYADFTRTKQMLRNLVSNAVKYAGHYGPIRISARALPQGFSLIQVADQGPGIAKTRLHEVFEPFSRLGPESASGQSAGVGLSLVKQLAQAQYGCVDVSSVPFVETRFWFCLPATSGDVAPGWFERGAPEIDPRSVFPD